MKEDGFPAYVLEIFRDLNKFAKATLSALAIVLPALVLGQDFFRRVLPDQARELIEHNHQLVGPALNAITIGVLLLWLGRGPFYGSRAKDTSVRLACKRFYYAWICAWAVWFLFYVFLLVEEWLLIDWHHFDSPLIWHAVENSFNNLQTGSMLLCYAFLAWPIAAAVKKEEFEAHTVVVPLFAAVTILAAAECVLAGLTKTWYVNHAYLFQSSSAFLAGIAIALIASRLSYLFIARVPISLIALLFYALIQTGYSAFESHPSIKAVVLFAAVPLKIWMYVFVRYVMTRGRILFYFDEMIKLHPLLERDWDTFKGGELGMLYPVPK
jgi:hypothetical protein